MEGRLNNPKFVKSASPEVVNETRENLEKRKEEEAQITNALKIEEAKSELKYIMLHQNLTN